MLETCDDQLKLCDRVNCGDPITSLLRGTEIRIFWKNRVSFLAPFKVNKNISFSSWMFSTTEAERKRRCENDADFIVFLPLFIVDIFNSEW